MISMDFDKLVYKRRTIRRFKQKKVPVELLKKLVDYGRVAPAGNNKQAISYIIVTAEEVREKIFAHVRWAASLPKDMRTPEDRRRPMAYIVVLLDTSIKKNADCDVGAAVENILLGITDNDLGACWMGAIDRKKIKKILDVPKKFDITHVVSIGYPDEESQMEPLDESFKYWKDDEGNMHVPKRSLDDVLFNVIE